MEEYAQDLMRDLDEDASEIEHTPDEDDSENAYTPNDDATVDEHTPDGDVPENVNAPDEVAPPAPTTPDGPIQQHPLPPPVDAMDLNNEHIANRWGPVAARRMAEVERLMDDEFRDFLRRRSGPYIHRPRDVAARRNRASFTAELINFAVNHDNAPNPNFEPISNRVRLRATVSWSLATDETSDLRQTLANVEDHVRSGRDEFQRERDEAQERAEILRHRRVANEANTERRVRELQYYRRGGPEIYLAFFEGVEG
ncbi:hypothetical protein LRP88_07050 [Fusarium phalaenopsidis]|nr:hypothetical protein NCS56_01088500 [Fusarium sp. Ph1]